MDEHSLELKTTVLNWGEKSIVIQISFVMVMFLLVLYQILVQKSLRGGGGGGQIT